MQIQNVFIIPEKNNIEKSLELAKQYGTGFEYNDFFLPAILEDEEQLKETIAFYHEKKLPAKTTVHGAFLDVTIHSDDPLIVQASDCRIRQSMEIAKRIGAGGVIFHTGIIPGFILPSYLEGFVVKNEKYFRNLCEEYPDIDIYMENMFDDTPTPLANLAERLRDVKNFGVCFDYAHAHVFGKKTPIDVWVNTLSPYVKHMHINDNDFYNDSHDALGQGKIDWVQFKKYYENDLKEASVLLEVTGYEKARQSLAYLKEL